MVIGSDVIPDRPRSRAVGMGVPWGCMEGVMGVSNVSLPSVPFACSYSYRASRGSNWGDVLPELGLEDMGVYGTYEFLRVAGGESTGYP
jgi:hypothetical protein